MRLINADEIDVREVIGGASDFAQDIRDAVQRMIDRQPTIEATPVVHGSCVECDWIGADEHGECVRYPKEAVGCSVCHTASRKKLLWKDNFCPSCGAKMDGKVV